jgi:hypothetical protein
MEIKIIKITKERELIQIIIQFYFISALIVSYDFNIFFIFDSFSDTYYKFILFLLCYFKKKQQQTNNK